MKTMKMVLGVFVVVGMIGVCVADSLVGMNGISVTAQKATVAGTVTVTKQTGAVTATAVVTPQTFVPTYLLVDGTTNTIPIMTNATVAVTIVGGAAVMTNATAAVTLSNAAIMTNIVMKLTP